MEAPPVLEFRSVGKRYGATVALDDVSFELHAGEVCGLLGENGAGKSTLVKILSGVVAPDAGEILLAGRPFRPRSVVDARAGGVSTAFQELSLVPTLSVAANMFLPRPPVSRFGVIASGKVETMAEDILRQYGVTDVPVSALIGDLPLGMRQKIEIVRALHRRPSILLLDEATAALSDRDWLFSLVEQESQGGTSILYISHKLDEIRRLCRRCVILRNGRKVLDSEVAGMSDDAIFSSMAGLGDLSDRSLAEGFERFHSSVREDATAALEVTHLKGHGVNDVSFSLAPGEILGVAGLEGHGQSNLFKALIGLSPVREGGIAVNGSPAAVNSPRAAQRLGLVLVPEERKTEGLFRDLTTMANISLPVIDKTSLFHLVNTARERRDVEAVTPKVRIPERFLPLNIGALSGGNQQKTVLARALLTGARTLLLFDPTRGVDVGAKQNIYEMMRGFVRDGGSILFYSTALDELVHLCDRCLVLYRNSVAGVLSRKDMSEDLILSFASGVGAARLANGGEPGALSSNM